MGVGKETDRAPETTGLEFRFVVGRRNLEVSKIVTWNGGVLEYQFFRSATSMEQTIVVFGARFTVLTSRSDSR